MGEPLEFDEAEARQEAAIHETDAVVERRQFVRDALALRPGADVLSVGCGAGYEPAEIAPVVGESGSVLGLDRSEAMVALASSRCADRPQVSIAAGDAADLPVDTASFDAAVAVQVYEYLDDVPEAAAELARVLRPDGRAVVYDTDFESLVWRTANPERSQRVLDAFEDHCPRPRLGSALAPILQAAGLRVERVAPSAIVKREFGEDTFAGRLARTVRDYVSVRGAIDPAEAAAWIDDIHAAEAPFFSLTQYCYVVSNPA